MKLPKLEAAAVPEEKIIGYLLSQTHRDGRHKAAFFLSFGFAASAPDDTSCHSEPQRRISPSKKATGLGHVEQRLHF